MRLWHVAALALICVVLAVSATGAPDTHPKYARVGGVETVWQRPPSNPKGIFFIAHGCMHQGTDVFSDVGPDGWKFEACAMSNFGKCLGLPEEVRLRNLARRRGYVVAAVSGGTGRQSCWNLDADGSRVAAALQHVRQAEGLSEDLPVFAMGASSGGAFVGALAAPGGLKGLQCIVPTIMSLRGAANRGVPTLFVHMPRDHAIAGAIKGDMELLRQRGVRAAELRLWPKPVTLELLSRCFPKGLASEVLGALRHAKLLNGEDYLIEDSRKRLWVEPVRGVSQGKSDDSLAADESCLAEELNVAWAVHEFSAERGEEMIDFCENTRREDIEPAEPRPGALRGSQTAAATGPSQLLVFDAGSSGTRVHIFDLRWPRGPAHVPVINLAVRERQTRKTKPGLSHFAEGGDLDGAQRSIEELIAFANQFVPKEQRRSSAALLKATAGLRLVSESQANAVMERVRRTLAESGYSFDNSWADIIRGKEEAGLAWVAANYLNGAFNATGDAATLGIIEMGGGSTQVSFEVGEADKLAESDTFVFTTALGRKFHLYAHSYAGFGQDHAQKELQKLLPATKLADPCYPRGYRRRPTGAQAADMIVEGTGDAVACSKDIEALLFERSPEAPGRYSGELPLRGPFVATQNFFYVRQELKLQLASSPEDMDMASRSACLSEVKTPSKSQDVPNSCFGLSYQAAVMRELRKRGKEVEMTISNSVNGVEADWALGAALTHALQELPQSPQPVQIASFRAAATALIVAVLALASALRPCLWPSREQQPKYRKGPDATRIGARRSKVAAAE